MRIAREGCVVGLVWRVIQEPTEEPKRLGFGQEDGMEGVGQLCGEGLRSLMQVRGRVGQPGTSIAEAVAVAEKSSRHAVLGDRTKLASLAATLGLGAQPSKSTTK